MPVPVVADSSTAQSTGEELKLQSWGKQNGASRRQPSRVLLRSEANARYLVEFSALDYAANLGRVRAMHGRWGQC